MRGRTALIALGVVALTGAAVAAPHVAYVMSPDYGLIEASAVEREVYEQLRGRNSLWADSVVCTDLPLGGEGRCNVTEEGEVTPFLVTELEDGSLVLEIVPTEDIPVAKGS